MTSWWRRILGPARDILRTCADVYLGTLFFDFLSSTPGVITVLSVCSMTTMLGFALWRYDPADTLNALFRGVRNILMVPARYIVAVYQARTAHELALLRGRNRLLMHRLLLEQHRGRGLPTSASDNMHLPTRLLPAPANVGVLGLALAHSASHHSFGRNGAQINTGDDDLIPVLRPSRVALGRVPATAVTWSHVLGAVRGEADTEDDVPDYEEDRADHHGEGRGET